MKKLMILPLLILSLVACQANTADDVVKNETNETNEINETEENQKVNENNVEEEEESVDLSIYDKVIEDYEKLQEMSMEEAEEANFEYVKSGALYYFYDGNTYKEISSTYYDLNNDGVDELLISLRGHSLIDLYTIVDGQLVSLFTDDMSADGMAKRSGYSLLKNGNLVYTTANGQGDKFGEIYELKETEMEYIKSYEASLTEGDFEEIEKALENKIDITALEWETVGKEIDDTVNDDFNSGDYSALEGIWKTDDDNGYHIKIKGNEMTFFDGGRATIDFRQQYSDETSSVFNLMDEDGFGALLYFYPKNNDLDFDGVLVPSDTTRDRIFITQSDPPEEKEILYKDNDLKD